MIALESMAVGTPVVISDGSFPEVVNGTGFLVDPNKPDMIAKSIAKVLKMSPLAYNKMVRKGLKQAGLFSWEKTAKETLSFFSKIVKR